MPTHPSSPNPNPDPNPNPSPNPNLGYKVPTTLEVSFVNKRLVPSMASVVPSKRRLPCSLDQPNVRAPDIQLNVWPWGQGVEGVAPS